MQSNKMSTSISTSKSRKRTAVANKQLCSAKKHDITKIINNNSKFLDNVNQILHNGGILFEKRIDIILQLIHSKFSNISFSHDNHDIHTGLIDIINNIAISKEELFQKVFMFYGSKYLKKEFDQFYTPLTIGEFMSNMCIPNKTIIDPACGTGDLPIHYNGSIHLWDISPDVIHLAQQNYKFQNKPVTTLHYDSILNHDNHNDLYDYAFVNPPFGSKTIITNPDILRNYTLGKDRKKQEIGILFIERSIRLLKNNGVLFIILPNGYFGNTTSSFIELRKYLLQFRILGIIKLPQKTFSRSGTGVSTSILIVSKTHLLPSNHTKEGIIHDIPSYNIFIDEVAEIGYELNKKNTPYKYKKNKTEYLIDSNGEPILHNDLCDVRRRFESFAKDNGITNLHVRIDSDHANYQVLNTANLNSDYILDISRYMTTYTNIVHNTSDKMPIREYILDNYSCVFKKNDDIEYTYLDIKEINTPLYNGKKMFGHELPNRARYMIKKNDVLVSRLKGNIAFTVILEDKENLVCTNGVCVLRPKDTDSMITIFGNLFSSDFKIQHQSLTTGSIMESLSDDDIKNIMINNSINRDKYQKVIDSVRIIQQELQQ
jgi:type I restriction enzyme M protein